MNVVKYQWFKVDQRSLRDRLKKITGSNCGKKNEEEKASIIEAETTELDELLHEIYDKKHEWDGNFNQEAEKKKKKEKRKFRQKMYEIKKASRPN